MGDILITNPYLLTTKHYFCMREYYTEAFVLDKEERGEYDADVFLYTEILGKVVLRSRSLRKIKSKSSAHLEPLCFAKVRFVGNGHFKLIDAIGYDREILSEAKQSFEKLARFLKAARFIKEMTPEHQRDYNLWQTINGIYREDWPEEKIYQKLLSDFGFDFKFAACDWCRNSEIPYFSKSEHNFLCANCALKTTADELVLIK